MKVIAKMPAWACGICGALYRFDDAGKELAMSCCLCSTPGCNNRATYTQHNGKCRKCLADKELVDAQDNLVQARERLRGAKQVRAHVRKHMPKRKPHG